MSGFAVLHLELIECDDVKTRAPNATVEIGNDCRRIFKWDEMFGRYAISLSKFKLE